MSVEALAGLPPETPAPAHRRWLYKLSRFLFSLFCLEMGVLLMIFPWLDSWPANYFASLSMAWREVWLSPHFRGAVSGLGVVNIGISLIEFWRFRRLLCEPVK